MVDLTDGPALIWKLEFWHQHLNVRDSETLEEWEAGFCSVMACELLEEEKGSPRSLLHQLIVDQNIGSVPEDWLSPKLHIQQHRGRHFIMWHSWRCSHSTSYCQSAAYYQLSLWTEELACGFIHHPPTTQYWVLSPERLKGYSGVILIHGLNHCETVLDSLSRDQVSRPLIYGVLSTSETTAWQQHTAVNGSNKWI